MDALKGTFTDLSRSIARNASTSPLLNLPPEIREKIWKEVLGNNLIHLVYLYGDDVDFETNESLHSSINYSRKAGKSYGSAWRHLVCEEDCAERRPDEKQTYEATDEVYWLRPHQLCKPHYDEPAPDESPIEFWDHETMRLTILRVSNQTYVEANRVLYASNTFSFADGITCKRFMMTRNIKQKRMIKSLRFEMEWWLETHKEWNSALTMPLVRSLSGLRNLRLLIIHDLEADIYNAVKGNFLHSTSWCEGLRKISILPLTSAEVHVRSAGLSSETRTYWTESDMAEVADGLREILLNPKGAEVYAEAREKEQEQGRRNREREAKMRASRTMLPTRQPT